MPKHGPRRARIAFTAAAAKQIDDLTTEAEVHALDRALVAISVNPELGDVIPGSRPQLREYADEIEDVRIIYFMTALRSVVVVAYLEA
jgi:hypothetical protein